MACQSIFKYLTYLCQRTDFLRGDKNLLYSIVYCNTEIEFLAIPSVQRQPYAARCFWHTERVAPRKAAG